MVCYIVIFELKDSAQLAGMREALKSFGFYCPLTARAWAIKTDMSAAQVRDKLTPAVGQGARLYVIRSGTEGAWRNAISLKHTDWLKKNL